jgi:hypothetical protein
LQRGRRPNMTCTRPQAERQIPLATRASSKHVSQVLMSDMKSFSQKYFR